MSREPKKKEYALKPRDRLFVQEYLVDQHITNAAKRAGFPLKSAHDQGSKLLKRAQIQALVEQGLAKQKRAAEARAYRAAIKYDIGKEALMGRLAEIAHADIDEYVAIDEKGVVRVVPTVERLARGGAIRKVSSNKGQPSIELHGRTQAIELLARMQGFVKDQIETTSVVTTTQVDPETMKKIMSDPEAAAAARALALKLSQGEKKDV